MISKPERQPEINMNMEIITQLSTCCQTSEHSSTQQETLCRTQDETLCYISWVNFKTFMKHFYWTFKSVHSVLQELLLLLPSYGSHMTSSVISDFKNLKVFLANSDGLCLSLCGAWRLFITRACWWKHVETAAESNVSAGLCVEIKALQSDFIRGEPHEQVCKPDACWKVKHVPMKRKGLCFSCRKQEGEREHFKYDHFSSRFSHLGGPPAGRNIPPPRWQRSDHSPGSRARPSRSRRRRGCTSYAWPRRWCDRASAPPPAHSAAPTRSSPACGFQGCTPPRAETPPRSAGGTRRPPRPLRGSCGRGCWGTWSECRTCRRSRTAAHRCIWLR